MNIDSSPVYGPHAELVVRFAESANALADRSGVPRTVLASDSGALSVAPAVGLTR